MWSEECANINHVLDDNVVDGCTVRYVGSVYT